MEQSKKDTRHVNKFSLNIFKNVPQDTVIRTISLWACFFSLALPDSSRGPCFLDLRDAVGISTEEMSYTFICSALGGLIGCFTSGLVIDRFHKSYRYLMIFACGCAVGSFSISFPFAPNLQGILGLSVCFGFFNGFCHTCSNVLFLSLWKGYNSSPPMYVMHFSFGVGSLLAPLLAKPFLRSTPEEPGDDTNYLTVNMTVDETDIIDTEGPTVRMLYPLLGLQMMVVFLPHIYFFIKERERETGAVYTPDSEAVEREVERTRLTGIQIILLMSLMSFLYFCIGGIEVCFRNFVSAFVVSLGHSRQTGSDVTALFYLTYTVVRGLVVFGGILISPTTILLISEAFCLVGTIVLSVFSTHSLLAVRIGVVLLGCGTSILFPAGILWLKDVIHITNRIGSVLMVSENVSVQLNSLLIGYVIDKNPLYFAYMLVGTSALAIIDFIFALLLTRNFQKNRKKPTGDVLLK